MKKYIKIALWITIFFTIFVLCYRLVIRERLTVYLPSGNLTEENIVVELDGDSVSLQKTVIKNGYVALFIHGEHEGETEIRVSNKNNPGMYMNRFVTVSNIWGITDDNGNFAGYKVIGICNAVYCIGLFIVIFVAYKHSVKNKFFSYETVFANGFVLLSLITAGISAMNAYRFIAEPQYMNMNTMTSMFSTILYNVMQFTSPMIILFAVALFLSNVVLLTKEKLRPANICAIILSILMIGGLYFAYRVKYYADKSEYGIVLYNMYCTIYVYLECMLFGMINCSLIAAKHKCSYDKDFVVILGCRIRKDGSLTPLLKGRADKAIDFVKKQAENGKQAKLICSGGQGNDEVMSEGEAIKRYALEQEIDEEHIIVEDKSKNTLENMKFSKAIAEKIVDEPTMAFSTTGYHVFRSGVTAVNSGIENIEGMGSKTKWYFGPNAFVREFVGLINSGKKLEIIVLALMIVTFTAFAVIF